MNERGQTNGQKKIRFDSYIATVIEPFIEVRFFFLIFNIRNMKTEFI